MKQFLLFITAAILGGFIALFGFSQWGTPPVASPPTPTRLVNQAPSRIVENPPAFNFKAAARIATPAVVHIATTVRGANGSPFDLLFEREDSPFDREGSGSGVFYRDNGYIITNNHVIEGAEELTVTTFDNRKFAAEVIGTDKSSDLAVLKVEGEGFPVLAVGDSDLAEIGEWVLAVGNPLDLTSTVTAGIISAKGRSLSLLDQRYGIESFLQTDAAVNPGNSGGALVDAQGRLLGINTAIATRTGLFQGYSFAIPINLVTRIVDDIIQFGSYQRAFLGVEISRLDQELIRDFNLTISQGVFINDVVPEGSAALAGIKRNDVIIRIGDRNIRDVPDLTEIVGRAKVGDELEVVVYRNGSELPVAVKMVVTRLQGE
jgi:serine protease Do